MYDCSEEGGMFDDVMTGSVISVDGVHKKDDVAYHVEVREISVSKQNEIDDEMEDIVGAVEECDAAYTKLTATGTYVVSSQGNRYFIDNANKNKVVLLKSEIGNRIFEDVETGDCVKIAPANILRNEISYYARVDVLELVSAEKEEIPSECEEAIEEIEAFLHGKK